VRGGLVLGLCTLLGCLPNSGTPGVALDARAQELPGDAAAGDQDRDSGIALEAFEPEQDASLRYLCDLGISPPAGEESFVPHQTGGIIPIAGVGQAGLTARPAIRIVDPDGSSAVVITEAVIELVLTNVLDGVIAESRPFDLPVELDCRDDGACYRGPVLVEISHLAKLPELEGLLVGVELRVLSTTGDTLCRTLDYGVLDRVR